MVETIRTATALVALGLLAACGAGTSTSPSQAASQMPMHSNRMDMAAGALGEPADASDADRTIQIVATDQLAFEPDAIKIASDETITFEIENTGTVDHEFVLGSAGFQEEHEAEMQGGEMAMDAPNEVAIPAGETVSLTWHFTDAGTTEFGCHKPGHFPAGMVGTITVS